MYADLEIIFLLKWKKISKLIQCLDRLGLVAGTSRFMWETRVSATHPENVTGKESIKTGS